MSCDIKDVIIKELKLHHDQRGWLAELFRHDEIPEKFHPVMSYVSMTKPDVARGPHEHEDQADMFCFIGPSTFRLYLWDNRPDSPTYKKAFRIEGGESNPLMVIVPAGVVHGYKNVGKVDGVVYNAPNRLFAGRDRQETIDEIRHENDPDSPFKIEL